MKKLLTVMLVLLTASFMATSCKKKTTETANSDNVFILGLDDKFPPMGYRNDNNEIVGFDIDLATEVTKRLGMELKIQPIDWGSKELELNTGKITALWNGLSVSPERSEAMALSKPYLKNRMVIMVKKDSPVAGKADLKGKKVGLQTGSTAVAALEKDPINKEVTQITYEDNILALQDLAIGRVDAVILDEVVGRYNDLQKPNTYKLLEDNFAEEYYAIGFKKDNTALRDKVDATIAEMIKDGSASKISQKWFKEDIIVK